MEYANSAGEWIRHIQALQKMILKLNSWSIFRAGSFLPCGVLREICVLAFRDFWNIHAKTKLSPSPCVSKITDSICAIFTTGKSPTEPLPWLIEKKAFSNVKWLFRRKLCASHSTGITGLFRTFSQLLHYQVLTDAAGNELLCLCDDHRKTIPLSVEDKTAYEAGNNHEHLLDDISDEAFSELVADAPVLCRFIYCNIKMQYPRRKLAVYAAVSRHDSLTIRFHQVWTGEPPYYDPKDFSSGDERVFSLID